MKKIATDLLSLLLVAGALFLVTMGSVSAKSTDFSNSVDKFEVGGIKPDKVEYIKQETGETFPVYHFENNNQALKYIKAKRATSQRVLADLEKEVGTAGNSISYKGTVQKDFTNTFMANGTSQEQSMSTQVKRTHSSQVNGKVSVEAFAKWFKAEVGYQYTNIYEYSNTFNVKVPAKKKGLITTYNYADYWTGTYKAASFWVSRPTAQEGAEIYIVNLDFPKR